MDFTIAILAPVLFVPLLAPKYLLPALPIQLLYLVSDRPAAHTIADQYTVAIMGFVFVAAAMALMGLVLLAADRAAHGTADARAVTLRDALLIGVAQALAIVPGVSRSGATISMALFLGYRREEAARFSFLLATPIVIGAAALKSRYLFAPGQGTQVLAGMVTAAIFGFASIRFLLAYVRTRNYRPFVYYRLLFAALVAAVLLVRRTAAG